MGSAPEARLLAWAAVDEPTVDEVRTWVDEAQRVVVLTGAGISTDSGIPDFRGPTACGPATPRPSAWPRSTCTCPTPRSAARPGRTGWSTPPGRPRPNAGHAALVELQRRGTLDTLVTQNIDGLHQAAGIDPALVVEIHGTMREVACLSCSERAPMERALDRVRAGEADPPCRTCGGILKSATISFGQNLVADDLQRADQAADRCDLMLAVGTTLGVYPAADLVPIARTAGARVVIVNGERTEMDHLADAVLRGPIGDLLPALVTAHSQ